eukprot:scaffold7259_cov267-Chaetoceros_neogracile.AAC.3
MSEMRLLVHCGKDPRQSVKDMDTEIYGLEMMSAGAKDEDDVMSFYRVRKLLGAAKDKREQILEERRVSEVASEWRTTNPGPNWNVDDEDTTCAFSHVAIPIDGTTFGRDGTAERLFCCGTRACSTCEYNIRLSNSYGIQTPLSCPVCKNGVPTTVTHGHNSTLEDFTKRVLEVCPVTQVNV